MEKKNNAEKPLVCLVGAAPDTGNLGVSALFASIVAGLKARIPDAQIVVFDNGDKVLVKRHIVAANCEYELEHRGMRVGRRYDKRENLTTASVLAGLGPIGRLLNSNVRCMANAAAVLDISGGDSFSDIYGAKRFWSVALPKRIACKLRVPLVLLPQTYGPFRAEHLKQEAARLCIQSTTAWARDERSFTILKDLCGNQFDKSKHLLGVDVAFGLKPVEPPVNSLSKEVLSLLQARGRPLFGFNISGLIYNDDSASRRFGFKSAYRDLVRRLINTVLSATEANLLLVPHVNSGLFGESDFTACMDTVQALPEQFRSRVAVTASSVTQCEAKWIIGQCDWFCGTRMHATIASLSQGVPTATINYSDKAKGVFECCQQGDQVFDPRLMADEEIVNSVLGSIKARSELRETLGKALPNVLAQAESQMDQIAEVIKASRANKET